MKATHFFFAAATSLSFGTAALADDPATDLVARGKYLATAGDCAACHTADGGKPFAGGKAIETSIGDIIASNITPADRAGIGGWSEADFAKALRKGVRKDGANLYPAMPYTAYAALTDEDVKALYAYFTQGVDAVDQSVAETKLPFPFNIRTSMIGWNLLFAHEKPFTPVAGKSDEWNRGAYLATALAHCSTCHTPRNALMAEKTGDLMAGASLGTWYAPNITSDTAHGIGSWSVDQVAQYLSTGRSGTGSQAGGPMLEAINKSLSKLTPDDIQALAVYVTSLPPVTSEGPAKSATAGSPIANDLALMSGKAPEGEGLYADNCASCHGASGMGGRGLPALVGNAAFSRPSSDNVSMAILDGVTPAKGQDMPAFADKLNDDQVASLTNFLNQQFGGSASRTDANRIAMLRAGGAPSQLIPMVRTVMIIAGIVVLLLLILLLWRWKARRV